MTNGVWTSYKALCYEGVLTIERLHLHDRHTVEKCHSADNVLPPSSASSWGDCALWVQEFEVVNLGGTKFDAQVATNHVFTAHYHNLKFTFYCFNIKTKEDHNEYQFDLLLKITTVGLYPWE